MLRDVGFVDVRVISEENGRAVITCRGIEANSRVLPRLLAAKLVLLDGPTACPRESFLHFKISAKNVGHSTWLNREAAGGATGAVRLGSHLFDEHGRQISKDYGGVAVERSVASGEEVIFDFSLPAPSKPGRYQLEFDMVSEHLTRIMQHRLADVV
jgi:hypothetical protein